MTYSTKQIATACGIHVNTVRLYEETGFITKPERAQNGYRIYTWLQLEQCKLARLCLRTEVLQNGLRTEVLQNGLRQKAVEIVRLCAALDMDASLIAAYEYRRMIQREIKNARDAISSAEKQLAEDAPPCCGAIKRKDAAKQLCVTSETLRTWERSGLITVGRGANGYRVYSDADMRRLNTIRTLRCANYSLTAILRLLQSAGAGESAEAVLNTPDESEDIVSVCDRLISSLQSTEDDAVKIAALLKEIKQKYTTLH